MCSHACLRTHVCTLWLQWAHVYAHDAEFTIMSFLQYISTNIKVYSSIWNTRRCAIFADGSEIKIFWRYKFCLFYWFCLFYMHVFCQQWRNKNWTELKCIQHQLSVWLVKVRRQISQNTKRSESLQSFYNGVWKIGVQSFKFIGFVWLVKAGRTYSISCFQSLRYWQNVCKSVYKTSHVPTEPALLI